MNNYDLVVKDIEQMQSVCKALMNSPHYKRMGHEGIFAIVQKAQAVGMHPLEALNGAMYYVNGKVELSAQAMNKLIRKKGHSIKKDPESTATHCILHGKRADNGDTWTASFSIEDAKRAGIYRQNWEKYPEAMCFARALSLLARQLFPDVIADTYVEGEIQQAVQAETVDIPVDVEKLTDEEVDTIEMMICDDAQYRSKLLGFFNAKSFFEINRDQFDRLLEAIKKHNDYRMEQEQIIMEA